MLMAVLTVFLSFSSCKGATAPQGPAEIEIVLSAEQKAKRLMAEWIIEQKIGQMFFCAFTRKEVGRDITEMDEDIEKIVRNYHIGGVILFPENIKSVSQVTNYIGGLQQASEIPLFIGIDEEGGRITRTAKLGFPVMPSALRIGQTGDAQNAYDAATTIANYLTPLGFNVDFAPVADVFTNPSNTVIGDRAFSADPNVAGEMVKRFVEGLQDHHVLSAVKHFPGHGDTGTDSHIGMATTEKTLAELSACEFIPFQAGIDAGATFVMTGHISTPRITGNDEPASFSGFLLQDVLRDRLGFKGIVVTDALRMGAIAEYYSSGESAVKAILAGVDMLLMPANLQEAYNAVVAAVQSGIISKERIDDSVLRILTAKIKAGLVDLPDKQLDLEPYHAAYSSRSI